MHFRNPHSSFPLLQSEVEILDLEDFSSCLQLDLPFANQEMVTVVDDQGRPLACGGTVVHAR